MLMLHEYMYHQNNPFNQIIMGLTISAEISFIILTKLSIYHTCTSKSKQRSFFFFKDKYIFNIRLRGLALTLEPGAIIFKPARSFHGRVPFIW